MTDMNQTTPPAVTQPTPDPTAILLAKTGLSTPEAVTAQITASAQQKLRLENYNYILQVNRQPFDSEATRRADRAVVRGTGSLLMAAVCPPLAIGLGIAAGVEYAKGGPARAEVRAHNRQISTNTTVISQDVNFIQEGQQALVAAQQAELAKQQQAAAPQFRLSPPSGGMG